MNGKYANFALLLSLCGSATTFFTAPSLPLHPSSAARTPSPPRRAVDRRRPLRASDGRDDDPPSENESDRPRTPPNGDPSPPPPPPESALDRALRVAKTRAEIRRLEADRGGGRGPTERERARARIRLLDGGVSPGRVPGSAESRAESAYHAAETALSEAVARSDFGAAARLRDRLDRMHVDDCARVLARNAEYYEAFSEKDPDRMRRVWLADRSVGCLHPFHPPLAGYEKVMESFDEMFRSDDDAVRQNAMEPCDIRMSVKGCTATLTCKEEVYAPKFVRGKGARREIVRSMFATNVFRKVGEEWFLVHHHASSSNKPLPSSLTSLAKKLLGKDEKPKPSSGGGFTLGGALGSLGGLDGDTPTVKRVFMGNLNDLVGGIDGILGNDFSGKNSDSDNSGGKTIIQVTGGLDDDDDDDEDDDEEDRRIIKQVLGFAEDQDKKNGGKTTNGGFGSNANIPKDALRQNCISALRKLTDQGTISQHQKRVLLTDIISCSAKGEFSMVEVAFELLCGEEEGEVDKDVAEEEFADQCRAFAKSFIDS